MMVCMYMYDLVMYICIYCWWLWLTKFGDEYCHWKLLMVDDLCIVYEYMRCRVICSCIHGQVLLSMVIVDGKLVMIIVDSGSNGKMNPRSKWYHMHVEACLGDYMHMNYVKCLILDYVTLVNYVNLCDVVYSK
jgi:hypothetical protein